MDDFGKAFRTVFVGLQIALTTLVAFGCVVVVVTCRQHRRKHFDANGNRIKRTAAPDDPATLLRRRKVHYR